MVMPTLKVLSPNFTEVTIGDLTLYFSYSTPVAFHFPGSGYVCRENDWGPTTGKHLNTIEPRKEYRLKSADFERRLDEIVNQ